MQCVFYFIIYFLFLAACRKDAVGWWGEKVLDNGEWIELKTSPLPFHFDLGKRAMWIDNQEKYMKAWASGINLLFLSVNFTSKFSHQALKAKSKVTTVYIRHHRIWITEAAFPPSPLSTATCMVSTRILASFFCSYLILRCSFFILPLFDIFVVILWFLCQQYYWFHCVCFFGSIYVLTNCCVFLKRVQLHTNVCSSIWFCVSFF